MGLLCLFHEVGQGIFNMSPEVVGGWFDASRKACVGHGECSVRQIPLIAGVMYSNVSYSSIRSVLHTCRVAVPAAACLTYLCIPPFPRSLSST